MTTIISVRKENQVVMIGDGQATQGSKVAKSTIKKVRRIYNNQVLVGFAGSTADAMTLLERFESKLEKHSGNLIRSAVELAKDWRTDKYLRNLEAMLLVADKDHSLIISGNGDVIEPEDNLMTIGSGSSFAEGAAKALLKKTNFCAEEIAETALMIAANLDIYTNHNFTKEILGDK